MGLFSYTALIRKSAIDSDDSNVKAIVGKEVVFLPETTVWIKSIGDFRFNVLPTGETDRDKTILICSKFLKPIGKISEKYFEKLNPKQDPPVENCAKQ